MNPIEYLQSLGWRITSDPTKYRDWYPDGPLSEWGYRKYWERHDGKIIYYDSYCNHYHRAYDLSIKEGAPVPAVVDGVIVDGTRQKGNFGGTVVLMDHKGDYQYICGHVKNIQVKVGDRVKQGQKLAEQSNTNFDNLPMNSHLHFQVQTAGWREQKAFVCDGIDPLKIDVNKYVQGGNNVADLGITVVVDTGHDPSDFPPNKGVYKNGRGYAEYDFNKKLAAEIVRKLKALGFTVIENDTYMTLTQRTDFYDRVKPALGISVHANAGNKNVGGRCAFYWGTSKQGKRFANLIIDNMKNLGYKFHGNGLHASDYGLWTNLHMVRECTTFPMVLVEHGFMTNDLDFPLIFGNRQAEYIDDMAEADVRAFCEYFGVKYTKEQKKAPAKPTAPSEGIPLYRVQVGAYGKKANAEKQRARVKKSGFDTFLAFDSEDELYRVQVGAFSKKSNADSLLKKMKNKGFKDAFIAVHDGYTVNDDESDANETTDKAEPLTGGAENIKYDGDWRFNSNTQVYWVPVEAEYTLAYNTYAYDKLPKIIRANRLSKIKAGKTIKVVEMCRYVEPNGNQSYEWAVYRTKKGRLRYLPTGEWDKSPGPVTNADLYGRFM